MDQKTFEGVESVAKAGFWVVTTLALACRVTVGELSSVWEEYQDRRAAWKQKKGEKE